jgi:predicted NAD/FAD-binding protein
VQGKIAEKKRVAIIGTGISGMAAAWMLSGHSDLTVYESGPRVGGHSNTVLVPTATGDVPVDTGFIVYNEVTYPNLTALFAHLRVPSQFADMSFSVSLNDGRIEYSSSMRGLFADKRNLVRRSFWSMLKDLNRFYREAPLDLATLERGDMSLGNYLEAKRYGRPFVENHLLPMAAAIWSAPPDAIFRYPAAAFLRFQHTHGLLQFRNRPPWKTVLGGSREYVERLTQSYRRHVRLSTPVVSIRRKSAHVEVRDQRGEAALFDHVVIACHADQALALLDDPSPEERRLLGAFGYSDNLAVLHGDPRFMPKRRAVWSSWNHTGGQSMSALCVTYWMNSLQRLPTETQLFVTLNPPRPPRDELYRARYHHPVFDQAAIAAQKQLWSLQGQRNTWYCGSYFGAGFHEDGLQSGLAVAEALSGARRPWRVSHENGRIHIPALETAPANPRRSLAA